MPTRALTVCAAPGCGRLVQKGRCTEHARQSWQHSKSRQARGYDADHERMRRIVMREESDCAYCSSPDQPELDHIIPLAQGGDRLARANLQRLCRRCHSQKTAREGNDAKG